MTTKELILTKIDALTEPQLDALYAIIEQFLQIEQETKASAPLLARLSQIKIDGPKDFAENLSLC